MDVGRWRGDRVMATFRCGKVPAGVVWVSAVSGVDRQGDIATPR